MPTESSTEESSIRHDLLSGYPRSLNLRSVIPHIADYADGGYGHSGRKEHDHHEPEVRHVLGAFDRNAAQGVLVFDPLVQLLL